MYAIRSYYDSHKLDNKIHYCADIREVMSDKLSIEIPELDTFLVDENDEKFSIAVYVEGAFLNENAGCITRSFVFHISEPFMTDAKNKAFLVEKIEIKV